MQKLVEEEEMGDQFETSTEMTTQGEKEKKMRHFSTMPAARIMKSLEEASGGAAGGPAPAEIAAIARNLARNEEAVRTTTRTNSHLRWGLAIAVAMVALLVATVSGTTWGLLQLSKESHIMDGLEEAGPHSVANTKTLSNPELVDTNGAVVATANKVYDSDLAANEFHLLSPSALASIDHFTHEDVLTQTVTAFKAGSVTVTGLHTPDRSDDDVVTVAVIGHASIAAVKYDASDKPTLVYKTPEFRVAAEMEEAQFFLCTILEVNCTEVSEARARGDSFAVERIANAAELLQEVQQQQASLNGKTTTQGGEEGFNRRRLQIQHLRRESRRTESKSFSLDKIAVLLEHLVDGVDSESPLSQAAREQEHTIAAVLDELLKKHVEHDGAVAPKAHRLLSARNNFLPDRHGRRLGNCYWGPWVKEGSCTCGGRQYWRRSIAQAATDGGDLCLGGDSKVDLCHPDLLNCVTPTTAEETIEQPSCTTEASQLSAGPVNCAWSKWALQTSCTCGAGKKVYSRIHCIEAARGGSLCSGSTSKNELCAHSDPCLSPMQQRMRIAARVAAAVETRDGTPLRSTVSSVSPLMLRKRRSVKKKKKNSKNSKGW